MSHKGYPLWLFTYGIALRYLKSEWDFNYPRAFYLLPEGLFGRKYCIIEPGVRFLCKHHMRTTIFSGVIC